MLRRLAGSGAGGRDSGLGFSTPPPAPESYLHPHSRTPTDFRRVPAFPGGQGLECGQ